MWTATTNIHLMRWIKALKECHGKIKNCDPKPLFIGLASSSSGKRIDKKGVEEMLRRLSHAAGLEVVANPHSFRHAFGRDLAKKGANNSIISSLMGHAHVDSSYVYTVMDDKLMEEQYDKYRR